MQPGPSEVLRIRVPRGAEVALGPGKAALLEAIAETGSISAAGRKLGMSYRKAWLLVDQMNGNFTQPLVVSAKGGAKGGGATVTPFGQDVLAWYRDMERAAWRAIQPGIKHLKALLKHG